MTAQTESTTPAQPKRPGRPDGVATEFTLMLKIKPGQADALREELARANSDMAPRRAALKEIGTLHNARQVMFDNDTRYMIATVFDGTWDDYIDDFAVTVLGDSLNRIFSHMEGYPGSMGHPDTKHWLDSQQLTANVFACAYPDLTLQQIWKDQRVNEAFQAVLDTPEFQATLNNPANAALVATPAFQKLLDEAAS
jgi:hypothetical protein